MSEAPAESFFDLVFDRLMEVGRVAVPICVVFGVAYWLIRRRASKREELKRAAWLRDRRDKRGDPPKGPADRA